MRAHVRSLAVAGLAAGVLGCVALGLASDRARPKQPHDAAVLVPFTETRMPFRGNGQVAVLDDGTLVIRAGGDLFLDFESPDPPADFEFISYRLKGPGVTLCQREGEAFLDVNGRELAARGLTDEDVTRTSFRARPGATPYALLETTGELNLRLDQASGLLHVSVKAPPDLTSFHPSFSATIALEGEDASTASDTGDGAAPRYTYIPDASGGDASFCTVTCRGGRSCQINCGTEGCRAYCRGSEPRCMCNAN